MNDPERLMRLAGALLIAAALAACGEEGAGDAPCPEGTVRSGADECITLDAGPDRPDGAVTPDAGDDAGLDLDAGPTGDLPVVLDDHFAASGFMGDGETGGISATEDCPTRGGDGAGLCHHFVHTPGAAGWAGVWWQSPEGNWGDAAGFAMPRGATRLQFVAWGADGGELITFAAGYGPADGFNVDLTVELSDAPTTYVIDLAGVPYVDLAGGFSWVNEGAGGGVDFYVDDIKFMADPADEVDPCTVRCATVRGLADCGGIPGYGACKASCAAQVAGPCGEAATSWLSCVGGGGWQCEADAPVAANGCAAEREALFVCEGGDQPATLPFYIDDHFFMTGYMGGGEIEVGDCPADMGAGGTCRSITWSPDGAPWVGFFFQHPGDNWGEQPGLAIAPGATHVRFRAWGETGAERANFAVGINDVDGFSNETGYTVLPAEPMDGWLPVPGDVEELTGGFAWFLENPAGAEAVTFYLDDVQWRDDAVPGAMPGDGCTAPDAENYDPAAEQDDGSCRFPLTFRVDMSCTAAAFGEVLISGPFCEWCAEGFPLADDDGDGIWEGTYAFPNGPLEYKYIVDGFAGQEDLIDDVAGGDGACAPITDGVNFANRQIRVDGPATIDNTYGQCGACGGAPDDMIDVTFDVDLGCNAPPGFQTVYVTGPFCEWCDAGFPLADPDGDGVWRATYAFPAGPLEYKYMVDNWASQEDLVDDVAAGGQCAPVTDGATFANRRVQLAADVTLEDTYGQCAPCEGGPVDPPVPGAFSTITFDDPAIDYALVGFGGAEDAAIEADPAGGDNMVARVIKSDAAELWAGTTIATGPNESIPRLPLSAANSRMTVRVYSPAAGVNVRLKVENSGDPTITAETEAATTVANAWEELTFDFARPAPGTAPFNPAAVFDKVSIFFNFGTPGAVTGARTYYFDDIAVAGGGGPIDPPDPVDGFETITFDDPAVAYVFTGFGGAEDAAIEADPAGGDNRVARVIKSDAAELWAGTTVSTGPNDSIPRLPLDAANSRMTVRVYAPAAGIPVRLKVEYSGDPTITAETEAATTVANAWEELTFDFANPAPGTAPYNPAATFDKVSIFFDFGTPGAVNGARTYYFDDIAVAGGGVGPVDPPDPPAPGAFGTITFDDPAIEYALIGFGGAEDAAVEADPAGGPNRVARVIKSAAAELWAGTTVATGPNESIPRIPLGAANSRMTVRVYSPAAGVPVRLKVENSGDPTITAETEATTTLANAWEVLTFDFTNQAPGTAQFNPAATFDKVSIFFNFGTPGAVTGARTYYFDDVAVP